MSTRVLCAAVAFLVAGLGLAWAADDKAAPELKISKFEQEILDAVNEIRVKNKLNALKPNAILFNVARAHSANQAKHKKMDHVLDGKNPADRVDAAGYDFSSINENIGSYANYSTKVLVGDWMKSKVHRDNILGKQFEETGIGVEGKGVFYITQLYATQQKKKE